MEVQDQAGRVLGRARLAEGVAGITRFHELIGQFADPDAGPDHVVIGIETDRGPWVAALIAAGYVVYAVNPRQAARYRERHGTSGAKSDAGDAHMLADMVRTDSHQLRAVAGDSSQAQAVKVVARAHQALICERTRHVLRLRSALREYFPAALEAFDDLAAPDALELLARAADPASAARLSLAQITTALKRARRRNAAGKAKQIQAALRSQQLAQPQVVAAAYAATVRAAAAVISVLNEQAAVMEAQVEAYFGQHPDAEIILSQPGLGKVLGARVLAEFGDDPDRYNGPSARKNYAGTSPITRASGRESRARPACAQPPPRRRAPSAGVLRTDRLPGRPRLLRPDPRPRYQPPCRPAPARQPAHRHPARMPQNQHPLRRGNRLAAPARRRRLTSKRHGVSRWFEPNTRHNTCHQ